VSKTKIEPTDITKELSKSYLDYAMSVIVSRALPDIRDGLKPVQRRILYAMHTMGLGPGSAHSKSAKVVGEVLGKYHPHGDVPVYDAMVRLAQDFSIRYPLVNGQGNFGSVDGDPPAAMRYTEAKLTRIATALLADIEKETVSLSENFDATLKEPDYLPALLPNMLLMGTEGIAVGMATKIPPHNLSEVTSAVIATIKKGGAEADYKLHEKKVDEVSAKIERIASGEEAEELDFENLGLKVGFQSEIGIEELTEIMPGPDFPTGGAIYDAKSLVDVYTTGRGRIVVRGIASIKEGGRGKSIIEITELPYQVNKSQLVAAIAQLVKNKKITGVSALRDESDKRGMSIVMELKRDARPKSVLNNIYKHTKLQTTFPANFVALIEGTPYTVNLKQIITEYIKHRQNVIVRRTVHDLLAAKRRSHILEGLKIALDNLDEVISTIRKSPTQEVAKTALMERFALSAIQATAILDMQLRRLAALEREKIENEYKAVIKEIKGFLITLKQPKLVLGIIESEILELNSKYGDPRKTKIYKQKLGEFSEEDLIPKEDIIITVTKTGYIKRVPRGTYKAQRRGGKGVLGMTTKEEDEIKLLSSGTTHDTMLFFTDKGRIFGSRAWEIPETSRQGKGQAIVNLIDIDQGEEIRSTLAINFEETKGHLLMATKKGVVKKTSLSQFKNLRSNGLIAIKMGAEDELVSVWHTSGNDDVMLVTTEGKSIRFSEKDVRPMGRSTSGMHGMRIKGNDEAISMLVFPSTRTSPADKRRKYFRDLLTISKKGLGKRTKLDLFPRQKRAGTGLKAAAVNSKTGQLAAALLVTQKTEQTVITSSHGQIIKLPVRNIPQMGRNTQGVILMRFAKKSDQVAAVTALDNE